MSKLKKNTGTDRPKRIQRTFGAKISALTDNPNGAYFIPPPSEDELTRASHKYANHFARYGHYMRGDVDKKNAGVFQTNFTRALGNNGVGDSRFTYVGTPKKAKEWYKWYVENCCSENWIQTLRNELGGKDLVSWDRLNEFSHVDLLLEWANPEWNWKDIHDHTPIRPLVKWPGGKRHLYKTIDALAPDDDYTTYIEPFAGGGAIFFYFVSMPRPKFQTYVLCDITEPLMTTYTVVKDNMDDLLQELSILEKRQNSGRMGDLYLTVRSEYNSTHSPRNPILRTAQFIFLNKTCFNGLYRENRRGEMNVSWGERVANFKAIRQSITEVNHIFQNNDVILLHGDYTSVDPYVGKRSFKFLDPPYKPKSATSNFTYSTPFGDIEQKELSQWLNQSQARWVMTNSEHIEFFGWLYPTCWVSYGKMPDRVGGKNGRKNNRNEIIITNFPATVSDFPFVPFPSPETTAPPIQNRLL